MNEAETIDAHILPALKAAVWGAEGCRIRREYRNTKLAVVEAKAEHEA